MAKKVLERDGSGARLEEAAAWLVRLESPEAKEADFLSFEDWVVMPGAREAFDRVHAASRLAEVHAGASRDAKVDSDAPGTDRNIGWGSRRRLLVIGGGAIAAAAVGGIVLLREKPWTAYATAKGEASRVTLVDGSSIRMNSDTSLRLRFGQTTRDVVLERGEAAFDVTPDVTRPFTVAAGDRFVRVLGTEVNVLYAQDRTSIAVRRGVVQVSDRARSFAPVDLRVGDELTFTGSRAVQRTNGADRAFAWQEGRLIYEDARLARVAADINRYYPEQVRVEGGATDLRFSGVLILDGQEKIIQRIEAFLPVYATRTHEGLVLRLRAEAAN